MMNKLIYATIGPLLLAIAIRGCHSFNSYLDAIGQATQERSAAYAAIR